MKKLFLFLVLICLGFFALAQTPQAFKYQAVARDMEGNPVTNQQIAVKISILSGSASGTVVYSELHNPVTNSLGLFDLEIGNPAQVLTGSFSAIAWGTATHFMKLEIDPEGGSDFLLMGTSQLLSVPYALFAENVANNEDADADPANELQTISKDGQTVTLSNNGGSFTDDVNDADADPANELQNLSNTKNGNLVDLGISNGTGTIIDVSDTDADPVNELQTLSQNGLDVVLSQGGGTISVADNDNDASNELQQLNKVGSTVSLSQNGGSFTDEVNDADANPTNELQTLSQNGLNVVLSQGGGTINIADNDSDPANELQSVLQVESEVTLSQNGGSFIAGVKSYNQTEIDALTPYNGLTVHNSTTNCINYYFINHWYEACGTCIPQPTQANAGPDQIVIGVSTTTLAANTPVQGTGLWTIISGEGGTLGDPASPTSTLTGVPTTDYVLAWTISTPCASLSDEVNIRFWSCGLPITDARDAKTYNTVQIGTQCWMAQNLNVGTLIAGENNQTNNETIEKYCYNNSDAQCDIYGGLYQWNEMMQYSTIEGVQGICMTGWHLPTDAEWTTLSTYLGGESVAGGKMKSTGTIEAGTGLWYSPNTDATNSSGFSGLPAGIYYLGSFNYQVSDSNFWSATQSSSGNSWYRDLNYSNGALLRNDINQSSGFSVRCLKD